MLKTRSGVFPVAMCTRMIVVSLFVASAGTHVVALAQEAAPQTEEERQARQALNKGVQDFKNGQVDEAIADFQRAKQLDPKLLNARLHLATAYASQFIPGAPSEENVRKGQAAVEEFRGVLDIDPNNLSAIHGIGSILFQLAAVPFDSTKFEESKSFHEKHVALRPEDPEPHYWIGVIDWTLSYRANRELRARYNNEHPARPIADVAPMPASIRQEYVREFGATIDEGIESLKRAIERRPDYEDAMAYLNLMYRLKADTVSYQNERDELLKMADDLVDRVKEIKQNRARQASQP